MIKVAINGFGRIGRLVFRIMNRDPKFDVVAINDLTSPEELSYLLKYDTTHGNYLKDHITYDKNNIIIKDKKIRIYAFKDPEEIPWAKHDVDIVFECTGHFTKKEDALKHIKAGAKKVLISAPAKGDVKTIVYGVNENILTKSDKVISAASCTTNCLAPIANVLEKEFGIKKGFMTTVHAYTNDQANLDTPHPKGIKSRRGRTCADNIVPTSTGAASSIGKVIPTLKGKLDGLAIRVPVTDGSCVDLTVELSKKVTKEEINDAIKRNSSSSLGYTEDPIVSSDIIGTSYGSVADLLLTNVIETDEGQLVKVIAWYDNEMSYSSQMVRVAKYFSSL